MSSLKNANILVVDDEPAIREILEYLIADEYNVFTSDSVAQAIQIINKEKVDLVITDYHMGDRSGFELFKAVGTLGTDVPIILISGALDARSILEAMKLGARDVFTKPFDEEELMTSISHLLKKRSYYAATELLIDELTESNSQLHKLYKAKCDFFSSVNHEIRTPLNGMIGVIDILEKTALTEEQSELVGILSQSSQMLINIANEILDLAKLEEGKFEFEVVEFSVNDLCESVIKLLYGQAYQKGITLNYAIGMNVPDNISSDLGRIKQVVINLLSNAIKYTETGAVRLDVSRDNKSVFFAVTDTGRGIPAEKMHAIFESYQQSSIKDARTHGGTGLGLTISQSIAAGLGGKIMSESEEGVGSKFTLEVVPEAMSANSLEQMSLSKVTFTLEFENEEFKQIVRSHIQSSGIGIEESPVSGTHDSVFISSAERANEIIFTQPKFIEALSYPPVLIVPSHFSEIDYVLLLKYDPIFVRLPVVRTSILRGISMSIQRGLGNKQCLSEVNPNIELRDSKRVLLVEDSVVNQKIFSMVLSSCGFTFDVAKDGLEGIELFERGDYDLILTDVNMPRLGGVQMAAKIREYESSNDLKPIPIIVLSGDCRPEILKSFKDAGITDHLIKPISPDALKLDLVSRLK